MSGYRFPWCFKMARQAQGGVIPTAHTGITVKISDGFAVVPDQTLAKYGRRYLSRLNGGGDVISVSEALAEMEDGR